MDSSCKIIKSNRLSSFCEDRFIIIDARSGAVLDDAQGWGYKSQESAKRAWEARRQPRTPGTKPRKKRPAEEADEEALVFQQAPPPEVVVPPKRQPIRRVPDDIDELPQSSFQNRTADDRRAFASKYWKVMDWLKAHAAVRKDLFDLRSFLRDSHMPLSSRDVEEILYENDVPLKTLNFPIQLLLDYLTEPPPKPLRPADDKDLPKEQNRRKPAFTAPSRRRNRK